MNLIDLHAHHFAQEQGVIRISNILFADQIEKQLKSDGLYSIGIHPRYIQEQTFSTDLSILKQFAKSPFVKAIGESGMDYLSDIPLSIQEKVFIAMIELSESAAKPLILHCVKAHAEIIQLHRQLKPTQPWIMHGFNQRNSIAEMVLQEGLHLSFGKALLQENSPASLLLKSFPDLSFFLETDESEISINEIYTLASARTGKSREELISSISNLYHHTFHHD
ncbi:TatD family hydrolase [soil metagenome]